MLSRMSCVEVTSESFCPRPRTEWKNQLESGFGIFQGETLVPVKLHFNAFRAPWIREQIWHKGQEIEEVGDGSLILSFPVCKFHEVKMRILQFGGDVTVLKPEELRQEVISEAQRTCRNYEEKMF